MGRRSRDETPSYLPVFLPEGGDKGGENDGREDGREDGGNCKREDIWECKGTILYPTKFDDSETYKSDDSDEII